MKRVISERDVEELMKRGGDPASFPPDAIYTPSARDLLRGYVAPTKPSEKKTEPASAQDLETLKAQICEIGHRLWLREFVDGNSGNISLRVGENAVLCTPTLVSKGFMKPEDICLVDLEGRQLAGKRPRTSEILMHLEIMKAQPRAKACVHAHPVHATAFAAVGISPPNNVLTEFELFIGEVPVVEYITPGTTELGKACARYVRDHNTLLLANHGVVAWGETLEMAYFRMEVIDAYCRTLLAAARTGAPVRYLEPPHIAALLETKKRIGIPDRRIGLPEHELIKEQPWLPGGCGGGCGGRCSCSGESAAAERHSSGATEADAEELVRHITDTIMAALKERGG